MIVASTSERERRTKDSETTNNIPNERTNRREIELVSEVKQIFNENWKQIHFKWNCSSFLCVFCVYCFAVLVIDHFTSKLNFPTGRLREGGRTIYIFNTNNMRYACVCSPTQTQTHTPRTQCGSFLVVPFSFYLTFSPNNPSSFQMNTKIRIVVVFSIFSPFFSPRLHCVFFFLSIHRNFCACWCACSPQCRWSFRVLGLLRCLRPRSRHRYACCFKLHNEDMYAIASL